MAPGPLTTRLLHLLEAVGGSWTGEVSGVRREKRAPVEFASLQPAEQRRVRLDALAPRAAVPGGTAAPEPALSIRQEVAGDAPTQIGDHNTLNYHVHAGPSSPPPTATPYQRAVHDRLQRVLGWHDLDAGRAAQLLAPHGFTFAAITGPARAVGLYDERLLSFLADFFQVSRPYLLAQGDQPRMPTHAYYKHVQTLCAATAQSYNQGRLSHVLVLRRKSSPWGKFAVRASTDLEHDVLILTVLQDTLGDQPLYTFRLWEPLPWSYPKSRLDMKCFLLFLEDAAARGHLIQVIGGTLDGKTFDDLAEGRLHAAQIIREGYWGRGERWYPTDFVTATPHLAQERHERPRVTEWYGRHGLERLVEAMDPPAEEPPA